MSRDNGQTIIIRRPNELLRKVETGDGDGGFDASRLRKAEAAVGELKRDYVDWVVDDLARLRHSFDLACSDPENRRVHLDDVAAIVHDVKGEAGTYGYPLITLVGDLLQNFVETIT